MKLTVLYKDKKHHQNNLASTQLGMFSSLDNSGNLLWIQIDILCKLPLDSVYQNDEGCIPINWVIRIIYNQGL